MRKTFAADVSSKVGETVVLGGWVHRLRQLPAATFVILKDASGAMQCVADPGVLDGVHVKLDDAVEIEGHVRADERSKYGGVEVDVKALRVVGAATEDLPFHGSGDLGPVGQDVLLAHRPLSLRNDRVGAIFRVQAALLEAFRAGLRERRFTEIVTSKIVGGGTEGGANLFRIDYFDRVAYLAQSPQFFKEHGVCGLERVFETGHVYRAEPHATVRHLTEYYSLDLEMGFVDGPEDVIALEKALLSEAFDRLATAHGDLLKPFGGKAPPSLEKAPTWEFSEVVERLKKKHRREDLVDDLDPEGERQITAIAEKETGCPAVFVVGFPLAKRPFYTAPRGDAGAAQSFDLVYRGTEITTGGQRLHTRAGLEASLRSRGVDPASFADHLRMFDLGMPPHGGLAIGLERLTAQVLGLSNIREATLYPRDRNHVSP
jgi:nondiscriminating aspartyl-tRNA synthetase